MYQQRRVKPNSEYYGNRVKRAFTLQRCFGSILQRQTSMNICLNQNKTTLLYNIVSAGTCHAKQRILRKQNKIRFTLQRCFGVVLLRQMSMNIPRPELYVLSTSLFQHRSRAMHTNVCEILSTSFGI